MKTTAKTVVQASVTPVSVIGNQAVCAITPRRIPQDEKYVVGGVVVLNPNDGPYSVEFHIEPGLNGGSPNLKFDESSPFYCNHGSCPAVGDHNPNMQPQANGPKDLTISPPPGNGAALIHYSLNFVGSSYDPIIVKT